MSIQSQRNLSYWTYEYYWESLQFLFQHLFIPVGKLSICLNFTICYIKCNMHFVKYNTATLGKQSDLSKQAICLVYNVYQCVQPGRTIFYTFEHLWRNTWGHTFSRYLVWFVLYQKVYYYNGTASNN